MTSISDCRLLQHSLEIHEISKRPHYKALKCKRAFQFLQLFLIQRVYGIDLMACSPARRTSKHLAQTPEQQHNYEVFLGGSCNPTTWRHDQAIPYFQSRSVSFYNPQVADWTPELIEIEHRAKELAPLLFFVIDHDTRALASMIEVCYLAARGRSIVVVMSPMPDGKPTKFIQQKSIRIDEDDESDYENVCQARQMLRTLLQSMNIPVFDNVRSGLECAAFMLEITKRTVMQHNAGNESDADDHGERDILTPLPASSNDAKDVRSSSVVVIRSISNKTSFDSPDEFYRQMRQSDIAPLSSPSEAHVHHALVDHRFGPVPEYATTQVSCSTNESDDDGYGSLSSSHRTLSGSTLSITSEIFECNPDHQRDELAAGSRMARSNSSLLSSISNFYSYIPFVGSTALANPSLTHSLFTLFTVPFRFLKSTIFSPALPLHSIKPSLALQEFAALNTSSSDSSPPLPDHLFDVYIASGDSDERWFNTSALPILQKLNVSFIKRQSHLDMDQFDSLYDIHARRRSRVLYYLINGKERLSQLTTELAFVIGERKHRIVVCLEYITDEHTDSMLSACERRDIQRSRKYLEDLVRKEKITLSYSREESWQQVVACCHSGD